ncbi:hypothetical protein [Halopiger djelfimassiliensis]|uniref:hypothetical protein n=1 Tax=Halopiger djelfimassiliensis TaxID=1293047 RepID=UPI000677B1F7|nr:hypothetical protein [Halopiger djelfimassiliensis]
MSDGSTTATRRVDAAADGSASERVPSIKLRRDEEGCCCLDCRNVTVEATRRTVLDALLWTGRLFRSRPSISLLSLLLVCTNRLLESVVPLYVPEPVVGSLETAATFAFLCCLRAYVATIVGGELTGTRVSPRAGLRHTLARLPALVGLAVVSVFGIVSAVFFASTVLFLATGGALFVTGTDPTAPVALFVLAVEAAVFLGSLLFILFKCWLAVDACVVGGYGPLESFRISWRVTTTARRKVLLLVPVVSVNFGVRYLVGSRSMPHGGTAPFASLVGAVSTSLAELLLVVWFGVYAHLYIQSVLDS